MATGAPAVATRSTGSAAVTCRGVDADAARSCWRASTNWPINLVLTSASTPRPNCATLPEMVRSVMTLTAEPSPCGAMVAVMVAAAFP